MAVHGQLENKEKITFLLKTRFQNASAPISRSLGSDTVALAFFTKVVQHFPATRTADEAQESFTTGQNTAHREERIGKPNLKFSCCAA